MSTSITLPRSYRCQIGDLVMLVRTKTPACLGRIGVIICDTRGAAAVSISHPEDLPEVQRRDWVVDFQGIPDVSVRDGLIVVTNRMACHDQALVPLRAENEVQECDAALTIGGVA